MPLGSYSVGIIWVVKFSEGFADLPKFHCSLWSTQFSMSQLFSGNKGKIFWLHSDI